MGFHSKNCDCDYCYAKRNEALTKRHDEIDAERRRQLNLIPCKVKKILP